jgi:transcriptional regulator with XRE-family HTH domain
MTPDTFRATLAKLGLTHEAAAAELEISVRTVGRYANGETEIPQAVILALKHLQTQRSK